MFGPDFYPDVSSPPPQRYQIFLVFFQSSSVLFSLLVITKRPTHLRVLFLFSTPHTVGTPSKVATSHLPMVCPPTVVFKTNKHHPYTSPFPGIAILYHISPLFVSKMKIPRDIDFLYWQAGFTTWVMEYTFIS